MPEFASAYAEALGLVAVQASSLGETELPAISRASLVATALRRAAGDVTGQPRAAGLHGPEDGTVGASSPAVGGDAAASVAAPTPVGTVAPESLHAPARTLEELYAELDGLVGLERVKQEVRHQAEVLRLGLIREQKGLNVPDLTRHLVFTGNPGTGKTTVARLVAEIYRALGVLATGQLVETDRSGLVAGYVGQTAVKTTEVITKAMGGVLFIDEAYSLAQGAGEDFGREAIDILVKALEDRRDDFVVIVAGYPDEMADFIDSNPGLASRFRLTIEFDDYDDDALVTIFERICAKADFTPTADCLDGLRRLLEGTPRTRTFGNARFVRNVFEGALVRQAWRLRHETDPTVDALRALRGEDLEDGVVDEADEVEPEPPSSGAAPR